MGLARSFACALNRLAAASRSRPASTVIDRSLRPEPAASARCCGRSGTYLSFWW